MFLTSLECRVSELVNSDTCHVPRQVYKGADFAAKEGLCGAGLAMLAGHLASLATTVSGKQIAEWINRAHLHHVSRARMGCLLALQTERNLHEAVKISQVIMHSRLGLSLRLRLSVSLARSLARALSQSSVCCLTKN